MADEPGPQDVELVKCPRCERIFSRTLAAVCPDCFQEEADEFDKVRDVLEGEPALNATQVADASGVSLECILRFLREGRVGHAGNLEGLECGRCGARAISVSKRLCEACLLVLDKEIAKAISETREIQKAAAEANRTVHETVERKRRDIQDPKSRSNAG